MSKKLIFSVDGTLFSDYGLHVESCTGLLNLPKRKSILANDDIQSHGRFYDLQSRAKYSEKTIGLNCFINATSRLDFFSLVNDLISVFDAPGLHRLTAALGSEIELPFSVIRVDNAAIEPTWNSDKTVAKFKLTFVEPQPIKRVVVAIGGAVSLSFHTEKLVTVSWGDGTYIYDLSGAVSVSKTLAEDTQIIIMGDVEEITNFQMTGGTLQWDIWS